MTFLSSTYRSLPDIWGEGAIFAFSGIDGETDSRSGFVASFGSQPYDLLIHTPTRRVLQVRLADAGRVRAATGDVLVVDTPAGELAAAFANWHTLVGALPAGGRADLRGADGLETYGLEPSSEGEWQISEDLLHGDALALRVSGGRFALAYGVSAAQARLRAEAGSGIDLEKTIDQRLSFFSRLPVLGDPDRDRLLKKCASVMKVNTLAAEGAIRQAWSTPDRIPHRHMWLWDSVFHSLAMNTVDAGLAWNFLKSVLEFQQPDGMIPHMMVVDGASSAITQPPLLAWGVWENYQVLKDRQALTYALPRLERYLEWDLAQRDQNGNGLLEWFIEGDVKCRSGESGMDNSPRFDEALLLDAVDFSTFAALDMGCVAQIAEELGDVQRAQAWRARAERMSRQVHDLLWDEAGGFYFDRRFDGSLTGVRAVSGFLPLLLPDLPAGRARRLLEALNDPGQFHSAFPVPSLSVSHPEWSTDMWRGATWINFNYFVILGLRRCGYIEEAGRLADWTVAVVNRYYRQYGVLFEFFDASDERPPLACDRKGKRVEPYDIRRKYDSIRDYHWTAALTARLLLDQKEGA